ncbi:MAG: hypothetical protein Q4A34_03400 [Candidatus Saccharibacteria bacterium]|nr:hypothetical protein [Candidatus Saccharibacteria bacterium]
MASESSLVHSSQEHRDPMILTFVDQTHDAHAAARDAAETRRREELNRDDGRIKRFLRNIWMGENGIAGRYYFEKYKQEALERIQQEGDINALSGDASRIRELAQSATISRFQSEYEEMIHEAAGERREELSGDSAFGEAMKGLIRRYASGSITSPEVLREEKNRILSTLGAKDGGLLSEGGVKIDNLAQIAETVRGAVEHGESLEDLLNGMKIYTGESRAGVRTEAHLNKVDRAVEKLQESKVGSLVSPESISMAAAIATGVARAGKGTLLRAIGVTAIPGVVGGVLAGIRENKRVKEERAIHAREVAQGGLFSREGRRGAIEETRYDTVAAVHITESLTAIMSKEEVASDDLQQLYQILADTEARVRLSDERRIDLISFSGMANVAVERFDLDLARARAKVLLGGRIGDLPEAMRNDLGIQDGDTAEQAIARSTDALLKIEDGMTAKDRAFAKLKQRRVAVATATGFASSFLVGVAAQEAAAFASTNYDGLVEHLVSSKSPSEGGSQTMLEGVFHGQDASVQVNTIETSDTYISHDAGGYGGIIDLPSNYSLENNPDGTFTIISPDGSIFARDIALEADGSLSVATIDSLRSDGAIVVDATTTITDTESVVRNLTVDEYVSHHSDFTTTVQRDFWYDNDTAAFDQNELRVHWAGDQGRGSDGSIMLSTAAMTADGSYHGSESTVWADRASAGSLKFAVSASIDSQNQVFMIDVAPDGGIIIPPDHPAAGLFSTDDTGQVVFNGAYGEVVEIRETIDGVVHMSPLATMEGDNSVMTIPTQVTTAIETTVPKFSITPPDIQQTIEVPAREVEGFGGPAIITRRPLENIARRRSGYYSQYRYGEYALNGEYADQIETFSPTLRENPRAQLDIEKELDWYDRQLTDTDPHYADEIKKIIDGIPEERRVSNDLKMIVTIPVAAASEADNIYNTLQLLSRQDPESVAKTQVLLNMNWLDDAESDPKKAAAIQKTLREIERAQADSPELRVAIMKRIYNRDTVEKTGGIIGYVARDLYTAALSSLREYNEARRREGERPADPIIQRYDADIRGMSRHAWRKIQEKARQYPQADILKGVTRLGTDSYRDSPGFGMVTEISTTLAALATRGGRVHTGGANFGIKASTLAAVGGLGPVVHTGVGSDDVELGRRVAAARLGVVVSGRDDYLYDYHTPSSSTDVIKLVNGSTIETDDTRFLRRYKSGDWWQSVWSGDNGVGSFNQGAGGYSPRDQDGVATGLTSERLTDETVKTLERNISEELSYASSDRDRARVLSLIFRDAPGAYTLENRNGQCVFTLTRNGRKYLKRYIKRDKRGRRYHIGDRRRHQLYGYTANGRRRSGALMAARK